MQHMPAWRIRLTGATLLCVLAGFSGCVNRPGFITGRTGRAPTHDELFPLVFGRTWTYRVTPEDGVPAHQITRVVLREGHVFTLRTGLEVWRVESDVAGLWRMGTEGNEGSWLLRSPIEVGGRWSGRHGGMVEIRSLTETVVVPAGTFHGCALTIEESPKVSARVETFWCPGVGPVKIEAWDGPRVVRHGELVAWGDAN